MKLIPEESVIQWHTSQNIAYPTAINLNCPHCQERGTFTTGSPQTDGYRKTVSTTASCPTCRKKVYFWSINSPLTQNKNDPLSQTKEVYAHPSPTEVKAGLERKDLIEDERIRKSYVDTLDVYNKRIWSASLTLARRTLEGIVAEINPDGKGNLANRLKDLQVASLDKPLLELTEAVKDGGNFGAHFDPEREPDQAMAEATLKLIEYLIEYIYVLPTMVKNLQAQINKGIETTLKSDEVETGNNSN